MVMPVYIQCSGKIVPLLEVELKLKKKCNQILLFQNYLFTTTTNIHIEQVTQSKNQCQQKL